MKCEAAKNNPLIMDQAIQFYLANPKGIFTFMSLWNDNEPYSKQELKICLNSRINKLKALFSVLPTIDTELSLKRLLKQKEQLQ